MELLHRRCCGLDVHKETVVACLRLVSDGTVMTEVRTFQTTTAEAGDKRLHACGHGGDRHLLEAVWRILDDGEFELVLANAAHVKNVPGRKTDVSDAMWLAELLAHGLIRASFVPNAQTQEMRNLLPRASNWFVSSRATCCGCKRRSRTPTSSWTRCLPT
jgi:transposase